MTVLITGGTGLIGTRLTTLLLRGGHKVRHLSRRPNADAPVPTYGWNPTAGEMDERALDGVDALVHLAGAGVADGRWTDRRKRIIVDSRVETAKLLHTTLQKRHQRLRAFVSASAVGYYGGDTGDVLLPETAPVGQDFLAYVSERWEAAADLFADHSDRVVKLRIGVVLSDEGGALPRLAQPARLGLGAPLGSGQQYLPWIHLADVARMFAFALEQEIEGIYNAVGPAPQPNDAFSRAVSEVLGRPYFLPPVPAVLMRLALGEMAAVVLGGNRVSSEKIEAAGFRFQHPELGGALRDLL
ncbi:MAG: TIGR01777 family oxidoreductase [Catalinimonas sp.]